MRFEKQGRFMNKLYFYVALALFAFAALTFAQPAQAHGNKKHTPAATQAQSDAPAAAKQEHHATEPAHTDEDSTHAMAEAPGHGHDEGAGGEEEEGEHSHWGANGPSTPFEKLLAYLGNFHALVVHFPIALFLSAALAQALLLTRKKEAYADIVRFSVWLAAFGALGAGLLGWAHAGPAPAHESAVMMNHRWIGTTILLGGFATALLMEAARKSSASPILRLLFTLTLFVMAGFVAANGFLGGALAHGGMKHLLPGMMG
jgi:uncharacterized membrane protein